MTLREQAPVWRAPTGEVVLTRYRELHYVLRHPELFPNAEPGENPLLTSESALAIYAMQGWPRRSVLATNPPEHKAYRALVDSSAVRSVPCLWPLPCRRTLMIRDFARSHSINCARLISIR